MNNSIYEISKDKDIIRILGRMPDTIMGRDIDDKDADILDRTYEVYIGSQKNLCVMLRKAGYQTTNGTSYTAVIIGDKIEQNTINSIPEECKKIDVYSIASWLANNKLAIKKYTFRNKTISNDYKETKKPASKKNIWLSTIAILATVAGAIFFFPVFLVILVFVPGTLNKFVRSLIK